MDRVLARDTAFYPGDPDAFADMLASDEHHFLAAEPVAVHDVEKQPIPSVHRWNDSEEPFDLRLREVGKLVRSLAPDDVHPVSLSYVRRDLDAFTHFRELRRPFLSRYLDQSVCKGSFIWSVAVAVAVLTASAAPAGSDGTKDRGLRQDHFGASMAHAAGGMPEIEVRDTETVGARWHAKGGVFEHELPMPERGSFATLARIDTAHLRRGDFKIRDEKAEIVGREVDGGGYETIRFYLGDSGELSTLVFDREGRTAGVVRTSDIRYVIRPYAGSYHVVTATAAAQVKRGGKRRAARSGPVPETIEISQSFWYHSRLAELWGRDNVEIILRSWVAAENTAFDETGNCFVKVVPAWFEQVDTPTTAGASRPNYAEQLVASDSASRLASDPHVRQIRFDKQLSLATYVDVTNQNGIGSAAAYTYLDAPNRWSGVSAIIVGKFGMEVEIEAFIHETGHVFGLNHHASNGAPDGRCPYSYGWIDWENEVSDVMSSGHFPRVLRYSNPLRQVVPDVPFGDHESSDGARRVREVASIARDFWKHALQQSGPTVVFALQ